MTTSGRRATFAPGTYEFIATPRANQRAYASASDAFPADAPRPVAPMLLLRNFTFSPVKATHLRIVARNSQCTGGPAYQGEQDADPNNATIASPADGVTDTRTRS